jgi:hypothetical protein
MADTNIFAGFDALSNDSMVPGESGASSLASTLSAPAPSAPDISTDVAGQPGAASLAGGTPPVQPAAPSQPVSWRDVLRGALGGMLAGAAGASQTNGRGGFAQGFGAGAGAEIQNEANQKEFQLKQQQTQSNIRFQDAQAADMAARAARRDHELHLMDQQEHRAEVNAGLENLTRLQGLGLVPTIVVPNNHGGAEAQAGMQQLSDSHGGVPALFTINLGDKIVGFDLNQLSQAPQGLAEVNKNRQVTNPGAPPIDQKVWQQMDPKQRNQMLFNALNFSTPNASEENLLAYQNYLETAKAQPTSPERDQNIAQLTGITTRMKSILNAQTARQSQQAADAEHQKSVATGQYQKNIAEANKADRAEGTGKNAGQMMVGSLPDGTQIAGTADELKAVNATGVTKLPSSEQSKVVVARQLVSPNGLISNVEKDIAAFSPGELDTLSARWNEFAAGKIGAGDSRYVALRTDTRLLSTALMQAHVGSKGSEQIMEHFSNLADAGKMNADTLKAAIATEKRYVTEKAMLPKGGPASQPPLPQQTTGHKVGDKIVQNGRTFTVTSVDQSGKVTGAQ